MMNTILLIFQSLIAVLLIASILVQNKGTGFTRSWRATSSTRRGLEKMTFRATFVLTGLFVLVSLLQVFI